MNILDYQSLGLLICYFLSSQYNWLHRVLPWEAFVIKGLWNLEWIKHSQRQHEKPELREDTPLFKKMVLNSKISQITIF